MPNSSVFSAFLCHTIGSWLTPALLHFILFGIDKWSKKSAFKLKILFST